MCIQVVERYAVCRCLYHRHSLDPCASYGSRSHGVTERVVLVGYKCPTHSTSQRSTPQQHNRSSQARSTKLPKLSRHLQYRF
ncbi:uncharacterized protein M437DRAFT_52058 [Aureobasidium melanogenum CBS 110374]|uniref:Uncharacterized protein n=1 Tax=Aureobasidium melanogenum (strain CBS 110374) TaxID=1043003 RepID=A0A074WG18_AURM1|nr:uncharacterized protein M437DRAFT_52058 [Aureobasidium melanogenum CBS 110374]KEQ61426.1 hypothetical protein M437DRAFT_52058 [Aureobasidium melanogenum CBS 110374]